MRWLIAWIFWAYCVIESSAVISDVLASMELVYPSRYESILSNTSLSVQALLYFSQGQLDASQVQMCFSVIDLLSHYPDLKNGKPVPIKDPSIHQSDSCGDNPGSFVGGTGSHGFTGYVKATENGQDYIVTAVEGIVQLIFKHQANFELSNALAVPDKFKLHDSITMFNEALSDPNIRPSVTLLIGMDNVIARVFRKKSYIVDAECVGIVFFLKELQHHGANNRLLHWLFDRARFRDQGFCLSVVTGSNNASHSMELYEKLVNSAGVNVKQFDCLSISDNTLGESIGQSMLAFNAFLFSGAVQVLIAANTMGDPLTNNLLLASEKPFTSDLFASNRPFVFLDLPNIYEEQNWPAFYHTVNGFLSLSRFGGSTLDTVALGKPIAVIYPPACSLQWIMQSPCFPHFETVTSKYKVTSVIADDPRTTERVRESVVLGDKNKYRTKYIIANRLDSDKCPALLLLAIKYIRTSLTALELLEFDQLAQFDFYGGGPLLRSLREMTVALGLEHMVTFRGAVAENELIAAMKQSDVLINPKIIGETFGFVHTEAAVMGLPVIAFRSGANSESVSSGVLIDPHSDSIVEDLASAVMEYYNVYSNDRDSHDGLQARCGAAKSRIAQWNIHRHSDSLMDAVRIVLTENKETKSTLLTVFQAV